MVLNSVGWGHPYMPASCTHTFLLCCRHQEGSLAHMLRRVTGPLLHHYALPAFQHGPDLAWLCMAPDEAQAHRSQLLQDINAANTALFGQLPNPPPRHVLLQNTVRVLQAVVTVASCSLKLPGNECRATALNLHHLAPCVKLYLCG